jgi:hypothetical protein
VIDLISVVTVTMHGSACACEHTTAKGLVTPGEYVGVEELGYQHQPLENASASHTTRVTRWRIIETLRHDRCDTDDGVEFRQLRQPPHIDGADQQPGGFALAGLDKAEPLEGVEGLG